MAATVQYQDRDLPQSLPLEAAAAVKLVHQLAPQEDPGAAEQQKLSPAEQALQDPQDKATMVALVPPEVSCLVVVVAVPEQQAQDH
jgi:hypothetical protein